MHDVRHVGNRLQRNFRAVECTAASRRAGHQLLGAAFLAFLLVLGLVLVATGFVEHFLHFDV